MSHLRQEDIRALEQTRQRLYQLTQNIGSLKNDVLRTSPMPQWDSIQISASILAQNLKSITEHLSTHSELFEKTVVYPSTNFPGRTQENLLGTLLRKKLDPGVETWVEEGRALQIESSGYVSNAKDADEMQDLWAYAKDFIVPRVVQAARTHRRENYTSGEIAAGIENVNTGLRVPPKLKEHNDDDGSESDEDEDEDEDDEMEDEENEFDPPKEQPALLKGSVKRSVDDILRFMVTGLAPEDE